MVLAHQRPSTGCRVRAHPADVRRSTPAEDGFSLMEMVVVLVIILIVGAITTAGMGSFRTASGDPGMSAAAEVVWTGIVEHRVDHHGLFPDATMIVGGDGSTLVDDEGQRYVRSWPEDPTGDGRIKVQGSPEVRPPGMLTGGGVLYHVEPKQSEGWIAAYGRDGAPVFVRGVAPRPSTNVLPVKTDSTTIVPVG